MMTFDTRLFWVGLFETNSIKSSSFFIAQSFEIMSQDKIIDYIKRSRGLVD